ncbi:MAG: PAS domain S-box protein [Desulfobaccales bacterium]
MAIRILLADDHQNVRQELRALLDQEPDFQVAAEVGTGEAALGLAKEVNPDVVILDLAGADLPGLETVRRMAAAAPRAKVIGLSLHGDRRFVAEVLRAGACGYLLKERVFEELAAAIRGVQARKIFLSQGIPDLATQDYLYLIRDSEARFRTIFEKSPLGIALLDENWRIVASNPALQELLGYGQEELRQQEFSEFILTEEAGGCQELFKGLADGVREACQIEVRYRRKDGQLSWGRLSLSFSAAGEVPLVIAMLEDISEQKQAEAEIRDYRGKLRSVALQLSLAEEQERRRLATELHDQVGQILALAQIKLGAFREATPAGLSGAMEEIRQLLDQTIRYTRSLTFELSPPLLYDLGFEAAVEWLAELIQERSGIHLQVTADRSPKPLTDDSRILLFHLVRELLLKVVKEGKAKNILVLIRRSLAEVQVSIENDGVGWDPMAGSPLLSPDGLGLFGIRERLQYLGGRLEVEFEPGHGSRLTLVTPLNY